MEKINCRNCNSKKTKNLFNLGKLSFTGKFPNKKNTQIKKATLNLVMCSECKLVQLDRIFDKNYLYGKDYGYRTGINKTMTLHVKKIVNILIKKSSLKKNDSVLDIGSNDGTLLNFYPNNINKAGIDPTIKKYKKMYKKINISIPDFFNLKKIQDKTKGKKFKLITALSMFYDLDKPNFFLSDVKKLLDSDGIFLLEQADLLSIIKKNIFDTICHEHLEYYSSKVVVSMAINNGLRVFDIKHNDVNGGSSQYYICHDNSKYKSNIAKIRNSLSIESKHKLDKVSTYKKFFKNINLIKNDLLKLLQKIKKNKKTIHGYGASTKGNVLLQYFNIGNKFIDFIAERNPQKYNKYTPGTRIKIISEKRSRRLKPDYYLVLPWHFKKEILEREHQTIKSGSKFIFPLPSLTVNK